jgi:hypothetical protein
MNKLEVNQVGGFPMTTRILDEIQKAHAIFNALGAIVGDSTIISGCTVTGITVSDGVVYVNGEVFEFRGGSAQTKVIIKEEVENLVFQNNSANPVIKTRYVTFGTGVGAIDWASFKRGFQTKDLFEALELKANQAIVTALSGALDTVITKLNTIDENAKVQVRIDWNATSGIKSIENRPDFSSPFLYKGVYSLGDVTGVDSVRTVNMPNIGTASYMVLGSFTSKSANFDADNDVFWSDREKTATSFKLCLREISNNTQNLDFNFVIISL